MATGTITKSWIDTLSLGIGYSGHNNLIHYTGDVYVVLLYNGGAGYIATFSCDSSGNLGAALIDSWQVTIGTSDDNFNEPHLVNVAGGIFACAWDMGGMSAPSIKLITFSIAADGTISKSALDTHTYGSRYFNCPRLLHISGSVWALSYCESYYTTYGSTVLTFTINDTTGAMSATIDSVLVASGHQHSYTRFLDGVGNYKLLVVGYRDTYFHGNAFSIEIDNAGNIAGAVASTLQFYTHGSGYGIETYPDVVLVGSGLWAIYFQAYYGCIYSISMDASGTLALVYAQNNTNVSVMRYDSVIPIPYSDVYLCCHTYTGTSPYTTSIEARQITAAGVANPTVVDGWVIDNTPYIHAGAIHVSGSVYLVAEGTYARTVVIETLPGYDGLYFELAFDQSILSDPDSATWTDCTAYLEKLHTKRGRMHELDRIEAGTAEFLLNNESGDWWRNNTNGTFYLAATPPKEVVKPLTLCRLRTIYAGIEYPLWYGVTESFNPKWSDGGGFNSYMELSTVDFFKTFAKYKLRLRSILTDATSGQKDITVGITAAATFYTGQIVKIGDDNNSEYNVISSISGDTITMTTNLGHTYQVSANAYVNKFVVQLSGARINCVLDDIGVPSTLRNFTYGTGQVQVVELTPPAGGTDALEHMQQMAEAEGGIIFQAGDGKITFHDSLARQTSPFDISQATFRDDDTDSKYIEPELVDDDTFIYNGASITGGSISEVFIVDEDAAEDQGERILSKDNSLIYLSGDAFNQALTTTLRYKESFLRCDSLIIKPKVNAVDLYPKVYGYGLSTRISLILNSTRNPAHLGYPDEATGQEYHIEGIEHFWSMIDDPKDLWETRWQLWKTSQFKIFSSNPHTGYIHRIHVDDSYSDCQSAADGTAAYNDSDLSGVIAVGQGNIGDNFDYYIARGYIEIDTTDLGAGVSIKNAYVGLHINGYSTIDNEFDLTIVSPDSLVGGSLALADYGNLLAQTTSYGSMTINTPSINNTWIVIKLNATGIAAINKGGVTKFAIRSSKDISATDPGVGNVEYVHIDGYDTTANPRLFVEME